MSELLVLPRAARRLGVPVKWLREQAEAGKVPCLRAGARYLFDLDAVRQDLAKQAAESRRGVDHAK